MNIILDDRENALLENMKNTINLQPIFQNINLSKKQLPLGDIIISRTNTVENINSDNSDKQNIILIERKTVSDLLSSIKDGRYEEQSHRLIHASGFPKHNIFYVIEGTFSFLKPAEKQTLYSAITSLSVFKGFSVYHTATIQETGEWILYMADKIRRDFEKGKLLNYSVSLESESEKVVQPKEYSNMVQKVKRENITPGNINEILLCQIPGISSVSAKAILNKFDGSFLKLLTVVQSPDTEGLFKDIVLESTNGKTRKISKACITSIFTFLKRENI
jgi:crossover junction endonuclease MUS81